jgi:hypothetical protein
MTMNGTSKALAIAAAMLMSSGAHAQKFYARSRLPATNASNAAATPPKANCGVPVLGKWLDNAPNSPGATVMAEEYTLNTPQAAQAWCSSQPSVANGACSYERMEYKGTTYYSTWFLRDAIIVNSLPADATRVSAAACS